MKISMTRLAFAVTSYYEFGGMQRALSRIAGECAARDAEVHLFVNGLLGRFPPDVVPHMLEGGALTNHGRNARFAAALGGALAAGAFDCVVGFSKLPGLDLYYAGDPCYAARVVAEGGLARRLTPRYRALRAQEENVFGRGGDTEILLINHGERDRFIRYYDTQRERFHLLPPGIDRKRLRDDPPTAAQRRALRRELGVGPEGFLLLNVGSRFKTKGVDRVLRAVAALPEDLKGRTRVLIVGDDRRGPCLFLARRLGIGGRVTIAAATARIADYYYAADLLVHPARRENTGTTLIEAMVCGLPVLVTENCGFAFHVRRAQAGAVCPAPFRQGELDRLLRHMLTADVRPVWGRNGAAYCDRSDLYSLVERAADIIMDRAERNRWRA